MTYDYLVVGAGFAGSTIAERLASQCDANVLVIDERPHLAGNAYDPIDAAGIRIHQYGPHVFHTSSDRVVEYLSQFTKWRPYEHRVVASVDGRNVPLPISAATISALYGLELSPPEMEAFFAERREPIAQVKNSEDAIVARVGREIFETLFAGYTRKQWGVEARELDAAVCGRVPIRTDRDDRYFSDRFQAMPADGFEALVQRMLAHPRIDVALGTSFETLGSDVRFDRIVYTGPIDRYFGYCFGSLPYRSLRFEFETFDAEFYQASGCVNYPGAEPYTRVTEFKHLTGQMHSLTTIAREYSLATGDPYYPIPRPESRELYAQYRSKAQLERSVSFVGRLAEYRYYNLDQVIASALGTFEILAAEHVA